MNAGMIFTALVVSIVFGLAAHKARKAKRGVAAQVYGWTGIAGYAVAMVGMA